MIPTPRQWRAVSAGLVIGIAMTQTGCHPTDRTEGRRTGASPASRPERQVTRGQRGRVLTNVGVWSPDGAWIAYDTRSDPAGAKFDGDTIEAVNIVTGEVRELYRSKNGAHCGVVTWHPRELKVVFILGPENPTPDWQYAAFHRRGIIVRADTGARSDPVVVNLDARDLTPPFTAGALRGGSHVHVWDAAGEWVSFTYEDAVLSHFAEATPTNDVNLRNIGVSAPFGPIRVPKDHPRNHDGAYFTVLATRTTAHPRPGSDDISRAFEEGWVGAKGYVRADGSRQRRALAFQGQVITPNGLAVSEVFIVDLPEDLTQPGDGPLGGTETRAPFPPKGCAQRRLTRTTDRAFPGIQGPRHWLRSSPDGGAIAFLMKDDQGIVQLWTVSPKGGAPRQISRNRWDIASAFTWSPDGNSVAHVMDNSVCFTDVRSGKTERLTPRTGDATAPRPEACVFSPNGKQIAYVRHIPGPDGACNQIFLLDLAP